MSLAMSAAPYNDDTNYTINSEKGKQRTSSHNKTQKRYRVEKDVDTDKMNNLLQTLHNSPSDDGDSEMGDFRPPEPPVSSGVERTTDVKESPVSKYLREGSDKRLGTGADQAVEYSDTSLEMNGFDDNYGSHTSNEEYYKKFIPNYPNQQAANGSSVNKPYYNAYPSTIPIGGESGVLLEKLNYMIHLLEEQQDERSGSVTEEVILYSFLGIFVIFLVDSFTRIGKYKR